MNDALSPNTIPDRYRDGYCDGWADASTYMANHIQGGLPQILCAACCECCRLFILQTLAPFLEAGIDTADKHLPLLEAWRDLASTGIAVSERPQIHLDVLDHALAPDQTQDEAADLLTRMTDNGQAGPPR